MKNISQESRMQNLECRIMNKDKRLNFLPPKFYQLNSSKNLGFTLVELIVVIVILAILWTIAFISFQGYSRNSRDSVRIADINSTKKSLEIFITKSWFYPTPDNGTNIIYSWATVWTEGTIWENVIKNIQSVSKVITDPLTSNEYTYSITSSKTEYQIGAISEWGWLTNNTITNTYATDLSKTSAVAYISWNYNEKFTKVSTWTTSWILAQPSIIATDIWNSDLWNILSNKKLSYNNYWNIPHSYNTQWTQSGWFNYTNSNPIIFTWTLEELHEDNQRKLDFITNLKQAYTSTDLATNPMYQDIMNIDTTNDSTWSINLVISYINSNKWGIKLEELALLPTAWTTSWWWTITYTCATQPSYTHATFTVWVPTQSNQAWQNTNSLNPCYYTCNSWYSWSDCSILNPYASCIWTWQFIQSTTTYWSCNSTDIIVCSWNWTWHIIAACNIWTNISWTWISSYWYYFQWWNNHPSLSWTTTTTTLANATWYGPWNYYSSTLFIIWSSSYAWDWTTVQNDNLWGSWWSYIQRQWPCENWYHLPTINEWASAIQNQGWCINWCWGSDDLWDKLMNSLKLPRPWYIQRYNWKMTEISSFWYYWTSNPYATYYWWMIYFSDYYIWPWAWWNRANWYSVRCFKN